MDNKDQLTPHRNYSFGKPMTLTVIKQPSTSAQPRIMGSEGSQYAARTT